VDTETGKTEEQLQEEELSRREALEHRDVNLNLKAVLATEAGRHVFKYLFKTLALHEDPEPGLSELELREFLGIQKAGRSIFKLACETSPHIASELLASIERERYVQIYGSTRVDEFIIG